MRKENGVIVPYDRISPEALQALLARGEAVIVCDLAAETTNIVLRRDLERPGQKGPAQPPEPP
ncbi:MAG: YheU family protein [Desulfobacterales bacterium]|nr:YheU family protein [Desulfobacterales bacterium]